MSIMDTGVVRNLKSGSKSQPVQTVRTGGTTQQERIGMMSPCRKIPRWAWDHTHTHARTHTHTHQRPSIYEGPDWVQAIEFRTWGLGFRSGLARSAVKGEGNTRDTHTHTN